MRRIRYSGRRRVSRGRHRVSPAKRRSNRRVSEKIAVLRHEGKDERQAAGMAYGMERAGRLRRGGKYVRARGKGKRRLSTRS